MPNPTSSVATRAAGRGRARQRLRGEAALAAPSGVRQWGGSARIEAWPSASSSALQVQFTLHPARVWSGVRERPRAGCAQEPVFTEAICFWCTASTAAATRPRPRLGRWALCIGSTRERRCPLTTPRPLRRCWRASCWRLGCSRPSSSRGLPVWALAAQISGPPPRTCPEDRSGNIFSRVRREARATVCTLSVHLWP